MLLPNSKTNLLWRTSEILTERHNICIQKSREQSPRAKHWSRVTFVWNKSSFSGNIWGMWHQRGSVTQETQRSEGQAQKWCAFMEHRDMAAVCNGLKYCRAESSWPCNYTFIRERGGFWVLLPSEVSKSSTFSDLELKHFNSNVRNVLLLDTSSVYLQCSLYVLWR